MRLIFPFAICHLPLSIPMQIDHINLVVEDLDAMTAFYAEVLGLKITKRVTISGEWIGKTVGLGGVHADVVVPVNRAAQQLAEHCRRRMLGRERQCLDHAVQDRRGREGIDDSGFNCRVSQ